jgi:hypothetical protein
VGETTAGVGVITGEVAACRAGRLAGAQNNHKAELLVIDAVVAMAPQDALREPSPSASARSNSQASVRVINS